MPCSWSRLAIVAFRLGVQHRRARQPDLFIALSFDTNIAPGLVAWAWKNTTSWKTRVLKFPSLGTSLPPIGLVSWAVRLRLLSLLGAVDNDG